MSVRHSRNSRNRGQTITERRLRTAAPPRPAFRDLDGLGCVSSIPVRGPTSSTCREDSGMWPPRSRYVFLPQGRSPTCCSTWSRSPCLSRGARRRSGATGTRTSSGSSRTSRLRPGTPGPWSRFRENHTYTEADMPQKDNGNLRDRCSFCLGPHKKSNGFLILVLAFLGHVCFGVCMVPSERLSSANGSCTPACMLLRRRRWLTSATRLELCSSYSLPMENGTAHIYI